VLVNKFLITSLLTFCFSSGAYAEALNAKQEASDFIKNIKMNSARNSFQVDEEVENLVERGEVVKENASRTHEKNLLELLGDVEKIRTSAAYKEQEVWIKENQRELIAKQAKPLPGIDYGISEKELQKDAIAKLLNQYRINPDDKKANPLPLSYPLMIFVSSSIPPSSLKDLMIQARKSHGVLIFRGVINGSLRKTKDYLAQLGKENVSAIIDPRLFEEFNITLVPTFVVLGKGYKNCTDSRCNFTPLHDRISGNVTLQYALEQFANGKQGNAKAEAAALLVKISGGGQS